jgi:hypothetical protein
MWQLNKAISARIPLEAICTALNANKHKLLSGGVVIQCVMSNFPKRAASVE